jgi:hypothetical protein
MLNASRASSKRSVRRPDSWALISRPIQWLTRLFGCWHKMMAPPYTQNNETYCVCMDCGAHREFNSDRGKMVGPYFHAPPTVLYESSAPAPLSVPPTAGQKTPPATDPVKTVTKTAA